MKYHVLKSWDLKRCLDLLAHRFEQARELYGDLHLGFNQTDLHRWLAEAGFSQVQVQVVDRQTEAPKFETLLATAKA